MVTLKPDSKFITSALTKTNSAQTFLLPSSGSSRCRPLEGLRRRPGLQGSGVPGETEQKQEEHLGSQQTGRTAVDYALYVHGIR